LILISAPTHLDALTVQQAGMMINFLPQQKPIPGLAQFDQQSHEQYPEEILQGARGIRLLSL